MNSVSSNPKFRKILFWFTSILLCGHILLAAQYIFFKAEILPGTLSSFYKKLIVVGPFFMDARITKSPHLFVSQLSSTGDWLPFRDMGQENFNDFQKHLWRFNKSKWSDYERYITRKAYKEIGSLKHINGSEGITSAELIRYVSLQYPDSDSIRMIYLWNTWQPERQSIKTDTGYNVIFKPNRGEVSE